MVSMPAAPANPADAPLSCVGLEKEFTEGPAVVQVLRGVNLTVARGERVAIIGASGAGKTTLLQLLEIGRAHV